MMSLSIISSHSILASGSPTNVLDTILFSGASPRDGVDLQLSSRGEQSLQGHQPSTLRAVQFLGRRARSTATVVDTKSKRHKVTGLAAMDRRSYIVALRGRTSCNVALGSREANMFAAAHASSRTALPIQLHLSMAERRQRAHGTVDHSRAPLDEVPRGYTSPWTPTFDRACTQCIVLRTWCR